MGCDFIAHFLVSCFLTTDFERDRMAHQYVYTMHGLGKSYGSDQEVLKNISLSFLPGAKIGVLGLNGAGKSTLLRIMAGELSDHTGEAFVSEGLIVGYLAQEPQLNPDKTVKGNV